MMSRRRVLVIGAGAAGLMAAGRAAECGAQVSLLEKMGEAGKKILVSGQERCNVTNTAPLEVFLTAYGTNGSFLRNAFHRFFREELLTLLRQHGVEFQVERGGRIFPTSGRAVDVRNALLRYASKHGVEIGYNVAVAQILSSEDRVTGVRTADGRILNGDAVILATGGASWPSTGSTGDGYRMARDLGHRLIPLRPALVPLTVAEKACAKALQGVSLRNVHCTLLETPVSGKDRIIPPPWPMPPVGELLFTHFGLSGPLVLSLSLAAVDAVRAGKAVTMAIDLKPGMTHEQIRARLQREFEENPHRKLPHLLRGWVPGSLAQELAKRSPVGLERPVHTIRGEERDSLVALLKDFRWHITGSLPLAAGMVTAGGIALKEVDPLHFASRLIAGLYLVGEVLDLAADTGGYNLQAAFSSGYLAGESAAERAF